MTVRSAQCAARTDHAASIDVVREPDTMTCAHAPTTRLGKMLPTEREP